MVWVFQELCELSCLVASSFISLGLYRGRTNLDPVGGSFAEDIWEQMEEMKGSSSCWDTGNARMQGLGRS